MPRLREVVNDHLVALFAGDVAPDSVCRSFHAEYLDRVRGYRGTASSEQALRKRNIWNIWVEPLFAEAKPWPGLGRFRLRGLSNVNIEALLVATGQNM